MENFDYPSDNESDSSSSDSDSSLSGDDHDDVQYNTTNGTPAAAHTFEDSDNYTPARRLALFVEDLNVRTPEAAAGASAGGSLTPTVTRRKGNKRKLEFDSTIVNVTYKDLINAREKFGYKSKNRVLVDGILQSHGVVGKIDYTHDDLKKISNAVVKIMKSRKSKEAGPADSEIILTLTTTTPVKTKPPIPEKKDFTTLKTNSKRDRLNVYAKRVRDFIKEMLEDDGLGDGTAVEELDVLAVCLKAANPHYERYSNDIRSRTLPKPNKIDIIDALSHKVECRSSQEQSNKLRRFLKKQCGVEYPSRYSLKAEKDKRTVPVKYGRRVWSGHELVPREVYISYPDALRQSVIEFQELGAINQTTKVIELEIKDGFDGAGNQMEIRQQWKKMVTMGFVILKVTDKTDHKNVVLWENLYPNSNFSFKPLSMTLEDETYDLCEYLFDKYPKEQSNMVVAITKNFNVNVSFKIRRCMVDGKLRGLCSGRSAAHCFSCPWQLADYYNEKKHQAVTVHYITIDNNYDEAAGNMRSIDIFFRVLREGRLGCADAKRRMNYTGEQPIPGLDSMTILHSVINCSKHMFNSLVIAECCENLKSLKPHKNMSSANVKLRDDGIKVYAKKLRKKMRIVMRDIGHGNTGGGLVGNHAKAFFENGNEICEKIFTKSQYTEHFQEVIRNLYVILLILISNLPVDIVKYQEKCRTTIATIQKNLPFFRFTPTLHTVLFHSWEHIQNHNCRGLGKYGEDAVEMAMGRFRNARKFQSFRGDLQRNMEDAFGVASLESNYFLTREFRKMKRSQFKYHKLDEIKFPEVRQLIDISKCTEEEKNGLNLQA